MIANDAVMMLFVAIAVLGLIVGIFIMFRNTPWRMDKKNAEEWLKSHKENENDDWLL